MFAIGGIVYLRLCRLTSARSRRMSELVLLATAAVAGLAASIRSGAEGMAADNGDWWGWNGCPSHRNAFGDLAIAATFGLALVLIRYADSRYATFRWMSVPLGWLGAISYSLYLTHNFNLRASEAGGRLLATMIGMGGSGTWRHVLQVGVLLGIAAVFYLVAERPFLNRPLRARTD
jgi:peptidoglycan/LPS O-acetylase OafA/YrhL